MKRNLFIIFRLVFPSLFLFFNLTLSAQSYLVGPIGPSIGTSANYTSHNHYNLFDVMHPAGIYIDSISIYPATAAAAYTVVVQNSAQVQIASSSGVTTVGGHAEERIKVNLFVPMGSGYRIGLTTSSVGMLRNSTGAQPPYTVPNVISLTGNTFNAAYWYFFYHWRVSLPVTATDAGLTSLVSPNDSVCGGNQQVSVRLKNYGPATLTATTINWSVNNVAQAPFSWTGSLAVSDSTLVNIGTYNFLPGNTYAIQAYTHNPNSVADTINHNDTVVRTGIFVKTAPTALVTTNNFDICQGDTAQIAFTLTGTPPWNLLVQSGSTTIPLTNIQTASFTVPMSPQLTTTYTVTQISDATGCSVDPGITVSINVFPAPPAVITPQGGTATCEGDSIMLMGSVGLNFGYQWLKNGAPVTGASSFLFAAKESGTYNVIVTSPIGCSNTSAPLQVFVHPNPVINLGNDTAVLPGQTVILNAGSGFNSYLWSTGATTQTYNASSATVGVITYWVQVTDNNGCKGDDTIKINFTNHIGVCDLNLNSEMRITPNPTDGLMTIHLSGVPCGDIDLEIYSQDGKKAYQGKYHFDSNIQTLQPDLRHLPEGIYLLRVSGNQVAMTRKLIISR